MTVRFFLIIFYFYLSNSDIFWEILFSFSQEFCTNEQMPCRKKKNIYTMLFCHKVKTFASISNES